MFLLRGLRLAACAQHPDTWLAAVRDALSSVSDAGSNRDGDSGANCQAEPDAEAFSEAHERTEAAAHSYASLHPSSYAERFAVILAYTKAAAVSVARAGHASPDTEA